MTNYRNNKAPRGPASAPGRATWGGDFITPINQAKVSSVRLGLRGPRGGPRCRSSRVDAARCASRSLPVPAWASLGQLPAEAPGAGAGHGAAGRRPGNLPPLVSGLGEGGARRAFIGCL